MRLVRRSAGAELARCPASADGLAQDLQDRARRAPGSGGAAAGGGRRSRNIFDTQVAAALVGFSAQVGYAELVREVLGVDLHKNQTRTDWSRRPLSAAQIDYALDDVRHLPPLRERLGERLEQARPPRLVR